ncbi:DNA (cytosine-5-)-methyltransferase [Parolsenella sp. LCP21S3_E11]|uniref:DNA (cytosine-5-)-methyltransferase n=1 Tax=Parolsenella sp. LCP21S3_E11 TaxID=3438797 RepID=UPI003F95B74B
MSKEIKVAELFAGVGGFRLGLDGYHDPAHPEFDMPSAGPFKTIWANQWEPPGSKARQFAARCYKSHFGEGSVVNEDINQVLDQAERGEIDIPTIDMVVGGFPCQDYSVARPLSQAHGIEGKKGVLWWDIYRFLKLQNDRSEDAARYCLFENVDRLLKSPASQRGRDFAIILSCLAERGYSVEWRVVNSAEYGFPQRRKRVYIFAERNADWTIETRLQDGVMSRAFPMEAPGEKNTREVFVPEDPYDASENFNLTGKTSPFMDAGVMVGHRVLTCPVIEKYDGARKTLGDVLIPLDEVSEEFFIEPEQLPKWEYLKGSKREERTNKKTGFTYWYSEGQMAFPDATDRPSRTILTGEGGRGASRFKHVIKCEDGRYRRLVPDELDQLQGFPRGWTNTGMTDGNRAFCMGNALVTGVPHLIGKAICELR